MDPRAEVQDAGIARLGRALFDRIGKQQQRPAFAVRLDAHLARPVERQFDGVIVFELELDPGRLRPDNRVPERTLRGNPHLDGPRGVEVGEGIRSAVVPSLPSKGRVQGPGGVGIDLLAVGPDLVVRRERLARGGRVGDNLGTSDRSGQEPEDD